MLEPVGGDKMIAHAAKAALSSTAGPVFVVLPPQDKARRAALDGLDVRIIEAPDFAEGMGGSLRNAIGYMPPDTDAIIIALADMPEITAAHFDALKTAYDPAQQREICRAVTEEGHLGHPVLFGRRFFENLAGVAGDAGARDILREYAEFVTLVTTPGEGAALDLDTPAAWENWRNLFSRHS
ncbi:MAG: nucleotidyltransferase family protein [Rhodobacteraceae bacterium]|nr:nucleotidyltransferase family protein [Paracoccaceae bacterium]